MDKWQEYWNKEACDMLLGKVITDVRYLTKEESENLGFYNQPVAFCVSEPAYENGIQVGHANRFSSVKSTWCFPMSDDEGNNGGALAVGGNDTLPVMRN
tara:strand:- start:5210 stop:5506 length:297 start_codon:yes stop_codon:yes gene_type:complete